jgi:TolB protein
MTRLPLLGACACTLSAAAAAQPDLLLFDSDRGGNYELYTMALDGSGAARLTHDATYDSWWGRPSPDGSRILFYRTPQGVSDTDYGQTSLWRIASDGTGLVQLRAVGADGWTIQGHAEWSPDGQSIATIGTAGGVLQIFVVGADGLHPRQVTTGAANVIDCSWSPDGASLLVVSMPAAGGARNTQEVYRVPAAGGAPVRLSTDLIEDYDPYYSPDGSRIAWLSQTDPDIHGPGLGAWNIRIMDADGGHVGRITSDLDINSKPAWSRDGATIYFHRLVYGPGATWGVYRTQAGGGGPITLVDAGATGNNTYPAFLHHAPVVTLTAPASGTVSGLVAVSADAASAAAIASVRFQVDGVDIATDTTAPYACSWDSVAAGPGIHSVRAVATDAVGGTGVSPEVALTVAGPAGGSSGGGGSGSGGNAGGGGCGLGGASAMLALFAVLSGLRQRHQSTHRSHI